MLMAYLRRYHTQKIRRLDDFDDYNEKEQKQSNELEYEHSRMAYVCHNTKRTRAPIKLHNLTAIGLFTLMCPWD